MKRWISAILAIAMLMAMMPGVALTADAVASQPAMETLTDLREELTSVSQQEEFEEEQPSGYGLLDLTISNKVATVRYCAPEDATVIVAVYSEDGMQLVTSANAPAYAAESTVQVQLTGSIPQYFQAAAYLVRTVDLAPLCDALRTSRYTKDMQQLLNSTVDSYPKDRVINLDADDTTNFLVMYEGVVQVASGESANIFSTVDRDNNRYVIENADTAVSGLQPGGCFVHRLGDGSWIIAKVESIEKNGATVTIQGANADVAEVFSHVKIQTTATGDQLQIDEATLGEGVTYCGPAAAQPMARTRATSAEPDTFFEMEDGRQLPLFKFVLELEGEYSGDVDIEANAELTLFVGVEITSEYLMVGDNCVSATRLDSGVKLTDELEGKATLKAPLDLGKWKWEILPGVMDIGFEPFVGIEISGEIEIEWKAMHTAMLYYDKTANCISSMSLEPDTDCKAELEGEVFIGLDFNPTVEVLEGILADADMEAMVGFFFTGKKTGTRHGSLAELPEDQTAEKPKELHSCLECIDGEIFFGTKFGFEFEVVGVAVVRSVESEMKITKKLCNFHLRLDPAYPKIYGLGTCPYRRFLVTVETLDEAGDPVADGKVVAVWKEDKILDWPEVKELGTTNENGIVCDYIPGGLYVFKVNEDAFVSDSIYITGTGKVRIDGSRLFFSPTEPGSSLTPLLEKIMDAGEVVSQGESGTIRWSMTAGGFLTITGTGDVTERAWETAIVRPRVVVVGEGITSLGDDLFAYEEVISVTLPSTLQAIGERTFKDTNIESIVIPQGVTTIGKEAFSGCDDLMSVTFPENLTALGSGAFYYCSALNNVILPRGITSLEAMTFYNCKGLTDISIPNTVTTIGEYAFGYCNALEEIRVHNSVTRIGDYAFAGSGLGSITLSDNVQEIGNGVFSYCAQLQTVRLPAGLKTIPDSTFEECEKLSDFNMPANLESIGAYAFSQCQSLEALDVYIPDSVQTIGAYAFQDCTGLTEVHLPAGLEVLEERLFSGCTALQRINIPSSVKQIGPAAFCQCESLQAVVLPQGVTKISSYAFADCASLVSVELLGDITEIGAVAFRGCAFTEFTVPDTVTVINYEAFQDCKNLERVSLSETGLQTIGDGCFKGCNKLTSVIIPDSVTILEPRAFYGCASLTRMEIPESLYDIPPYTFYGCTNLAEVIVPETVVAIGEAAFYACSSLKAFDIPEQVTAIEDYTFYMTDLEAIEIPEGVVSIGTAAFYKNQNLKEVLLPDGVTEIGDHAFAECVMLERVVLPAALRKINGHAFYMCGKIRQIQIPLGVALIAQHAFSGTGISTVTIPWSVEGLGYNAFSECPNLQAAYFEGDAPYPTVYMPFRHWFGDGYVAVWYPAGNATWDEYVRSDVDWIGGHITWVPYTPEAAAEDDRIIDGVMDVVDEEFSALEETTDMAASTYGIVGGEYTQETVDGKTVKTARFTDLIPGQDYLLLAVANMDTKPLLNPGNVLYVAQVTADPDGKLSYSYIQRTATDLSFVMLCGGPKQDLSAATVTFPKMTASDIQKAVSPVVEQDGKRLREGVEYSIEGDVTYTAAGTYQCTIRGIYGYGGTVQCSYTVSDYMPGDINGDQTVNQNDVVYLLLHTMFGEQFYPLGYASGDVDRNGTISQDDAVYLLLHTMFGQQYYPI